MVIFNQPKQSPLGDKFGDWHLGGKYLNYLIPSILPSLFLRPDFVVGMPVAFATFRLALVTPKARFQLKDKPGILKELFLAILFTSNWI